MSMAIKYAMKKRARMKEGGAVGDGKHRKDNEAGINRQSIVPSKSGVSNVGYLVRSGDTKAAKGIIKTKHEFGHHPNPNLMAEGGEMHDDMVDRIMARRAYSKGGMIANGGDDDLDQMADGRPNNFDDLALRDELEFNYTGANSGDELGNEQEDQDRHDIVARIMRSRAKKDRMPRPA